MKDSKVKLGIDIDDVITNTSELLLQYIDKYGSHIDFNNPLNNKIDILRGRLSTPEVKEFMNKYATEMLEKVELKPYVAESIEKLKNLGYEINIITTRSERTIKNANAITKKYLKDNNIFYDNLFMDVFDKKEFCLKHNINVMIDDSVEICSDLTDTDVKPILFNSEINKNIEINVVRVDNWKELLEVIIKN